VIICQEKLSTVKPLELRSGLVILFDRSSQISKQFFVENRKFLVIGIIFDLTTDFVLEISTSGRRVRRNL
jgi:hypothetical protein